MPNKWKVLAQLSPQGWFSPIQTRARSFIQDPNGFGELDEDFMGAPNVFPLVNTGTPLGRQSFRGGAGKFGGTWSAGQGMSWMPYYQSVAPSISNVRTDAWYLEWLGVLVSLPTGSGEAGLIALAETLNTGTDPVIPINSEPTIPYLAFGFYGAGHNANYVIKVYDQLGATRFINTGIPFIMKELHKVSLAADGLGTFDFRVNGGVPYTFVDARGMSIQTQTVQSYVRGPSSGAISLIHDRVYAAGGRS